MTERRLTNLIPQVSIIVLILVSMFAHTAVLVSNSTASYAYSACSCVIFAMDDIEDYGFNKVQLATMDYFISMNLPFTASIIASQLANSSNLEVFHKIEDGIDKKLFEIAIHGYRHINHTLLTKDEQEDDFRKASGRLEYLFGKRADIFIPPYNEFNLHTIEAMSNLNISILSTSPYREQTITNPYKSETLVVTNNSRIEVSTISDQKALVYHVPFSVSLLALHRNGLFGEGLVQEALRRIEESIAEYGFAHVRLHPSDFPQVDGISGKAINEVDNIKFQELVKIVDSLADRNIRIASFREIYPSSNSPSL
jgi:peptidoglycan/xylan/chitin deacetylase (PgdA/CDA1 family)